MKSCVTVSLVEEARGGPFIFWGGVADACERAAALGFDAIEIFPPAAEAIDAETLRPLLDQHGVSLAAVGTGAGWVKHGLSLTAESEEQRRAAVEFVKGIIDVAAPFGASAIIGSMQGRWTKQTGKDESLGWLAAALDELGRYASEKGPVLLYEPLNRYETNLCNTIEDGIELLGRLQTTHVKLLADLFHMNIEEADIAAALRKGAGYIGHLHFVDSNRRPATCGHLDYRPIAEVLREIDFQGYASAEAFPHPDAQTAAETTIQAYRERLVG